MLDVLYIFYNLGRLFRRHCYRVPMVVGFIPIHHHLKLWVWL